ncbi:MAG: GHKL domain-containing protein [Tannerella sp.]|nr:GHKL domain-containing protein [Tannerella sp.]
MKSKWFFWIIVVFITGILTGIGFLFFRNDPVPFWIIQCIVIASVILSSLIYRKLIRPYNILLSGMQLLKEQDFSTHLRPVKNKEANQLIEIFNRMISQLRNERSMVREKNHFLDLLIKASPQGIIILDFNKQISDINPAGMKLLNINNLSSVKGCTLNKAPFELADSLAALKSGDDVIIRSSGMTAYRCIRSSFMDQGFDHPFILIEELTHEFIKIEKDSYERIIRMMSHEVNNSVGAIGATLNVVSDIIRLDGKEEWQDVLPAVEASFERCGNLAHFIKNLAHVVKIPEPSLSDISLNELIRSVDALTRIECQNRNIRLVLSLTEQDHTIYADGIQLEQVLVNIIKNAYEAIEKDGEIRIITQTSPLSVTIEDNGPGISAEAKQKLFTPFFTTKKSGQGIGLMFVRDVLINHHFKFSLDTENGWTKFKIFFE